MIFKEILFYFFISYKKKKKNTGYIQEGILYIYFFAARRGINANWKRTSGMIEWVLPAAARHSSYSLTLCCYPFLGE